MPGLPTRTALKTPWNKLRVGLCGLRDGERSEPTGRPPQTTRVFICAAKGLEREHGGGTIHQAQCSGSRPRTRTPIRPRSIRLCSGPPKRRERAAGLLPGASLPHSAKPLQTPGAVNTAQSPGGLKQSLAIKPLGAAGRDARQRHRQREQRADAPGSWVSPTPSHSEPASKGYRRRLSCPRPPGVASRRAQPRSSTPRRAAPARGVGGGRFSGRCLPKLELTLRTLPTGTNRIVVKLSPKLQAALGFLGRCTLKHLPSCPAPFRTDMRSVVTPPLRVCVHEHALAAQNRRCVHSVHPFKK